jgi:Fic family protein
MTYREFYNAVLNANISDEMNEASVEFLSKLDSRNEKRKTAMTKDKVESASRRDMVLNFLRENEGQFTRDQIAEAIGITANQVTGACKTLVDGGLVTKTEIKIEKSRKIAYSLA